MYLDVVLVLDLQRAEVGTLAHGGERGLGGSLGTLH